jgi:acetyl esterase/lipase
MEPGMTLDVAVSAMLDQLAATEQIPFSEQTPEQVRATYQIFASLGLRPENRPSSLDLKIGTPHEIPIRVYKPPSDKVLPLIVFFHGGGWSIGDIESHGPLCEQFAVLVPAVVVSVGYRLAPEHPYPAAVTDRHLVVAGDSSGGNLAAVTCLKARDSDGPTIAFQLLICPVTDLTCSYPSHQEFGQGYLLTSERLNWFITNYVSPEDLHNPDVSPLCADRFAGLPSTMIVTAGFDPLRDEGEAYADRLHDASVPVETLRYDSMVHGFLQLSSLVPSAQTAIEEIASKLAQALESQSAG